MHSYASDFLGFSIHVPESWELVSWRHSKIKRSWQALYQIRDDELPDRIGGSKFLFTANRLSAESKAVIEASIEMSIHRLPQGEDFYDTMLANIKQASRKIHDEGAWIIGDECFSFLDEVIERKRSSAYFRFVWRHIEHDLWLYAKIAGYSTARFAEAIEIFGEISFHVK